MTEKQKENYRIRYEIDNHICQYEGCNKRATQQAHRIANNKINRKKYGSGIIDCHYNLVPVCCIEHNDSFNIGMNPKKCRELIDLMIVNCEITNDGLVYISLTSKEITGYIEE